MRTADLDYHLPAGAIAQHPAEPRDAARLLVDAGLGRPPAHRCVADLPSLVGPGDVVVVNTTRVLPARLRLRKATGGAAEVLLLERTGPSTWEALVRPGRRLPAGTRLVPAGADDGGFAVEVGEPVGDDGRRQVLLHLATATAPPGGDVAGDGELAALERHGVVPLPPYIAAAPVDPERYQTVFADRPESVAAPTAGLHLTTAVLDGCRAAGARVAAVELAVGLGTFQPITAAQVDDHHMHGERYRVPAATQDACAAARRVIAVGTTAVRALEATATSGCAGGRTELFIRPPWTWQVVDVLLTNFHLPRSSLLALVEAFIGPRWRDLYCDALAEGYRFASFGDAMLLGHDGAGIEGSR